MMENPTAFVYFTLQFVSFFLFFFNFLIEAAAELLLFANGFCKRPSASGRRREKSSVKSISNVLHLLRIIHDLKLRNEM